MRDLATGVIDLRSKSLHRVQAAAMRRLYGFLNAALAEFATRDGE